MAGWLDGCINLPMEMRDGSMMRGVREAAPLLVPWRGWLWYDKMYFRIALVLVTCE